MDRKDILKRLLYPKCKTALEFQFDTLIANPLLTYITIQDIAQLNKIATSIKYSSKPKEKYKMIDNILVPRGFKKMASGTNRVTYRFLNDYRIVLKVAIDKVGLSDNGNEYRNQHLLKPFVTKCFEVSPCGTVGLFERVVPITSREEFVNISEDVFDLINNLIGKYVLEDIGEKFYMNYGLREGFGPVLLDYPYVFELDGRKLICNVPEPLEPLGYCGGEIDYDLGYNNLICTKCGKRYLATELKSDSKSDKPKIIIKGEDSIMKAVLKRGSDVVALLNSEDPVATNTIKPRKQYNQLRGKLSNKKDNRNDKQYKPSIKTHDDVHLQARLKGYPKGKDANLDKNAREKEKRLEENTPKIQVSFEEEKKETVTVKEEFSFNGGIKVNPEYEKAKEDFLSKVNEIDKNILPEAPKVEEVVETKVEPVDDGSFRAIIKGYEIWNLDTNELIGYINSDTNDFEKENESDKTVAETKVEDNYDHSYDKIEGAPDPEIKLYGEVKTSFESETDTTTISEQVPYVSYEEESNVDTVPTDSVVIDDKIIVETKVEEPTVNHKSEKKSESFGTSLADIMPAELRNNTSYKTDRIVTPIENQFSASNINNDKSLEEQCNELEKEESEVPELIIHKRNEEVLNEF